MFRKRLEECSVNVIGVLEMENKGRKDQEAAG